MIYWKIPLVFLLLQTLHLTGTTSKYKSNGIVSSANNSYNHVTKIRVPNDCSLRSLLVNLSHTVSKVKVFGKDNRFKTPTVTSVNYSPYFDSIAGIINNQGLSSEGNNAAIVVSDSCSTQHIQQLKEHLKDGKSSVFCHVVSVVHHYQWVEITEQLHSNKVIVCVLLLPWYLVEDFMERVAFSGLYNIRFITIELTPSYVLNMQRKHLKITNLKATDGNLAISPELLKSSCTPHKGVGRNIKIYRSPRNIKVKVVTVLLEKFVFIVPKQIPKQGNCLNGIPCKINAKLLGVSDNATEWKDCCCAGSYVELFLQIVQDIKFDFELYVAEDNNFGAFKNGSWNGMIGDIHRKKADIAMHQITVLVQRFNVVEFTHRIIAKSIPLGIVIRNGNDDSKYVIINWDFIESLNTDILIALVIATTLVFFSTYLIENVGYLLKYGRRYPARETLSYVNGVLWQRDLGGVLPRGLPGHVVSIVYAFGMTIMIGTYTAQLTANNISIEHTKKFRGFKDPKFKDPSFRVGVQGSSSYEYFMDKQKQLKARKININNWREGIESVYNKNIDAFVGQSNTLEAMINLNTKYCGKLILYREHRFSEDMAFAVQKESTLGAMVSSTILRLTENGRLQQIIEKWKDKHYCENIKRHQQFPWQYGGGLLLILGISVGVCVLILIAENMYTYRRTMMSKIERGSRQKKIDEVVVEEEQGMRRQGAKRSETVLTTVE